MMAAQSPVESRLRRRAAALALLVAAGELTLDELRAQMRQELDYAVTAALLSGTGGQRNSAIDAALGKLLTREYDELDRLIDLLSQQDTLNPRDVQRRLDAFADALDDIGDEGARLVEQAPGSPLIPLVIGAALGGLLGGVNRRPGGALPRLDSLSSEALYNRLLARMDELSDLYSNGELLLDDWYERMQREIAALHGSLYQQGVGRALTAADLQRVQARIRAQYDFLDGFRADVEAGTLTPDGLKRRARMYLSAAKSSLQEGAAAALGLPRLPAYPGEGSECQVNCKCTWVIRMVEGGADAYWTLRPSEHCQQCLARSIEWNPLQIRNGVIQPYNPIGLFV